MQRNHPSIYSPLPRISGVDLLNNFRAFSILFKFGILDLGFVSGFDIQISDFSMHLLGVAYAGLESAEINRGIYDRRS